MSIICQVNIKFVVSKINILIKFQNNAKIYKFKIVHNRTFFNNVNNARKIII